MGLIIRTCSSLLLSCTTFKAFTAPQTCCGEVGPGGIGTTNPGRVGGLLHLLSYRTEADESVEEMSEDGE